MRGIVLAGGAGTRLYPMTRAVSKQLLPVYDKPLVYYPLSVLMLAGLRDILLISTPTDLPRFQALLGDGAAWGLRLAYAEQPTPAGLAQALLIARDFLQGGASALILGDNLFFGHGFSDVLRKAAALQQGALIFGYPVRDPERYGVLAFDSSGRVCDIVEKPPHPPSRYAVPGLYFYGPDAPDRAAHLRPSSRGELEITDLNLSYLREGRLEVHLFGRGLAWLDTGNPAALLQAANFVQTIEERQGFKIACIEEIAYRQGWIDRDALLAHAASFKGNEYGEYLERLATETV